MKRQYKFLSKFILTLMTFIGSLGLTNAQSNLIVVEPYNQSSDLQLYVMDTTDFNVLATLPLVGSKGENIIGINGLAKDANGNFYGSAKVASYSNHVLCKINIATGIVTMIDTLVGEKFSNLAFANGTLYGVTGQGSTTPEALFTINTTDASLTLVDTLAANGGYGGYGAIIGYCKDNGMLYAMGTDTIYKIDPTTNTISYVAYDTNGYVGDEYPQFMEYIGGGKFVMTAYYTTPELYILDTLGNITLTTDSLMRNYYGGNDVYIKGVTYVNHANYSIQGPTTFCLNDPNGVLHAGLVGNNYQWTKNGVNISGADSNAYVPTTSGFYNCFVTVAGVTDSASTGLKVKVNALPVVALTGDTILCTGDSVKLMGTSGGTLQWYMNGDTISGANSATYYATTAGVYNMLKTNLNGCSDSSATSIVIVEYTKPAVNAVADDADFCKGGATVLRATGADVYTWSNGGDADTLYVMPSASTTYTVSGIDTVSGCYTDKSVMITVYSLPNVVITPDDAALCNGDSTVLRASGAISYVWNDMSTDDTLKVIPSITTEYWVVGTESVNGCSDTAKYNMVVSGNSPVVAISTSDTTICVGASTTLDATGSDIASVSWSTNATTNSITVMPAADSTYEVIAMNGCGSDTAMFTVKVNALPVITFTVANDTVCSTAGTESLSATPVGGTFSGTGVTGSTFDPSAATISAANIITYSYTDGNGCANTATASIYVDVCAGINTTLAKQVSIYPNPATELLNVKVGNTYATVTLMDMTGRVIESQLAQGTVNFNFSNLSNGMYVIKVQSDKEVVEYKVTKQ